MSGSPALTAAPPRYMSFQYARSAVVQADLAVTPGQTLYACMGVGGGAGGGVGAGDGGGYASLANGSDGSDPILVAGGGGGAGGSGMSPNVAIGGDATLPGGTPGHGSPTVTLNGGNSASDVGRGHRRHAPERPHVPRRGRQRLRRRRGRARDHERRRGRRWRRRLLRRRRRRRLGGRHEPGRRWWRRLQLLRHHVHFGAAVGGDDDVTRDGEHHLDRHARHGRQRRR